MRLPTPLVRRIVKLSSWRIFDPRLSWEVQRRRVVASTRLPLPPRGTTVSHEVIGGVPCDVVTCGPVLPDRTVLHLHGGGFVIGSPKMYRSFAARLSAATRSRVVVADYRLAPEHPFPAAVDDSVAVWQALAAEGPVAVSGDSAGGNLALLVALRARDEACQPVALALIAPAVDLDRTHFDDLPPITDEIMLNKPWTVAAVDAYAGEHDVADPRLSPIHADFEGLTPMILVAAVEEALAGQADRLSKQATAAGVDVIDVRGRGMWHCYPLQASLVVEADQALTAIGTFLNARFDGQ